MQGSELRNFVERVPKAELHVHLEGSIRAPTLLALARRRGVDLPSRTVEGIEEWFEFRDFDQFLDIYLTISRCLRDPEDFQIATRAFLEERARENIVYTEVHFTISTHVANGANELEVAEALAETVTEGERDLGVALRWIPDIVRNVGVERADQTLEWALAHRDKFVVALGLSGKEDYPTAPFREHFEVARREGLRTTVHAGEQTGPQAVWDALELCGAERIGHGFRSVEDPALLERLSDSKIPLEVSPTSNIRLGLVPSLEQHPIGALAAAGVAWSLNSDDPALFHTTLASEYRKVAGLLDLDLGDLGALCAAAFDHAFLGSEQRRPYRQRLEEFLRENGIDEARYPSPR